MPEGSDKLNRFTEAQQGVYANALRELQQGAKTSHWMWFIFPQVAGLGYSSTSRYYALKSPAEARAYMADPVLGTRLRHCTQAVMALEERSAQAVFGKVDAMKFRSCMTLFASLAGPHSIYQQALDKYFHGEPDQRTIDILARM